MVAVVWSSKLTFTPLCRKLATSRRSRMICASNSTFGKITGSGRKNTVVPLPRATPVFFRGATGLPCLKLISYCAPSRRTVATRSRESALTTLAPTPCRPPAVL